MNALLNIENLRVAYPEKRGKSHWAINNVSLTLQPGEKLGLVGESGCGKSTLGRAAMRLLPQSVQVEGSVTFGEKSVFGMNPSQLRKFRGEAVALVFQDPMTRLDPLMTIGDHCIETIIAHQPHLSKSQAEKKSIETLETVNIPASRWSQYPHEFSGGMRQRVAIALALLLDPKLIVADEPTTSLDVTIASQILQELTRLCQERQTSLLLISHDLAMVGEYCDSIAVMYGGEIVEKGAIKQILHHPQHEYTKSLFEAALHIQVTESNPPQIKPEKSEEITVAKTVKPILQIKDLVKHYSLESNFIEQLFFSGKSKLIKAVDGVNLNLYSGEILGLVGESGCGKSTLSRTILQLIKSTSGSVEFQGKDLTTLSHSVLQPYRREMQMIFQDPLACLNPMMTVNQIIADPLFIHNLASTEEAKIKVEEMLEKVGLTPVAEYGNRYPSELSGGQQQRVAIARALITNPKLIICDEPVSMLDATIQTQVLELMLELKQELNLTYLFITHDLWVARFICDRIAVMNSGKIVEQGKTEEIFNSPQHSYTQTLLNAAPLLSTNYGNQSAIGAQNNNIVININNYIKNIEINPNCPYRESFLLPEDAGNFFGRDEFLKKLIKAVETNNFVPVLGESKSGKSSAILAGLVPKLIQGGNWLFTYFWPVKDPFDSIAQALVSLYIPEANKRELKIEAKKLKNSLENNSTSLAEFINKIQQKNPGKRILIIADQFEQIYNVYTQDKIREQFINTLLQTFQSATQKSPLSTTLVTIIRTNSSGNIGHYIPLPDTFKKHSITLEQMTRDQLREVIEKPSENFGIDVETRLVERLIEDVIKQEERLAFLAFALIELWKKKIKN